MITLIGSIIVFAVYVWMFCNIRIEAGSSKEKKIAKFIVGLFGVISAFVVGWNFLPAITGF